MIFLRNFLCASIACLTIPFTYSAQAQQTSTLQPVVVSATRSAQPVTDVLADVTVIDRAAIEQAGMQSLAELLASVPGVQFSTSGSYRSISGVFLRGASTSQTIFLVNGVRVGSATTGAYSVENLPIDRIERVEVLRGAGAALYGPDAVGGVIQVFTREGRSGSQKIVSIGVGSDGQSRVAASIYGQTGGLGYGIGISSERAKGINAKLPTASGFNSDRDGFEFNSIDASLKYQINRQHQISGQWLVSQGEYGFDGSPFPNPLSLTAATARAESVPKLDQLSFKWIAKWTDAWTSTLQLGASKDTSVSEYVRESDGAFGGDSRFNTKRRQLSWQNDVRLGGGLLTLIAEQSEDEVDSSTAYVVSERKVRGLTASYALRSKFWDGLLTVRNDNNSQFGSFTNWAISGGFKLNEQWRFTGSVGTTFQAPSFNQLYFPNFGNPSLTPQQGKAQELALRYQQDKTLASVVVYRNQIDGFINPATNAQSSLAVLKGFSLSFDTAWNKTTLSASYDYADPRLKPSDQRVVRVARNVLRTQVSHQFGNWKPFAELRLVSNREDNRFPGRVALAGYGLLNLGTSYQWNQAVSVQARLNNLSDTQYSLADGFTMPGRNLFVSLNWKL